MSKLSPKHFINNGTDEPRCKSIIFLQRRKTEKVHVRCSTYFPNTSSISPRDGVIPRNRPWHDNGINSSAGYALSMYDRYA